MQSKKDSLGITNHKFWGSIVHFATHITSGQQTPPPPNYDGIHTAIPENIKKLYRSGHSCPELILIETIGFNFNFLPNFV